MHKILIRFTLVLLVQTSVYWVAQAQPPKEKVTPENALQHYLHNGDTTFRYELKRLALHQLLLYTGE